MKSVGSFDSDASTAEIMAKMAAKNVDSGLRLKQFDIGESGLSDKSADALAKLIELNTPITNMSLTANRELTLKGWKKVANALAKNHIITTLSLDYNDLGDEGAEIIASSLEHNNTIRSLDLEGNKIGNAGGHAILNSLKYNHMLNDITLSPGNKIDKDLENRIKASLTR